MNGFCGRLNADGTFAAAGARGRPPESYLGCEVLVRGHLAGRAALSSRFGLYPLGRASDAELLAHAFRAWGSDLPAHVFGEYSAVVWDVHARTALFTHDALGIEPLFYARGPDGLTFATELVELIDAEAAAALDDEYLADFLAYGAITSERTPYRGILRLLPGRSLRWSGGELHEIASWNLADVPALRCRDDAEYEERFRTLLEDGVRATLDGVGRAGVSLSGGLDSSTIACVAARAGCSQISAYSSISPRWPDADEQPWMRAVVEKYGIPWYRHDVETALPFSRLPAEFLGEPTGLVIDEHRRRIQRETLRSHGLSVMLDGDGGDAVLCSSPGALPRHLADALFDGSPLRALRSAAAWKRDAHERRSWTYWIRLGLVEPAVAHLRAERVRMERVRFPTWLGHEYATAMHLEARARRRIAPPCRHPGRQVLWEDLWTGSLRVSTRACRATAYDVRKPLLYVPLVEFMASIPWEQKLRPRCDRYLQRRALKDVLPESIRRRASKAVGTAPFVEGLRRSREWFGYLTDAPLMAERGIVDAGRWRVAVQQAGVGQTNSDKYFFAGVAVEAWLKQLGAHCAQTARRPAAPLAV
jgi:asparagine synthase (glutamine-hydrolysing)